MLSTNDKDTTEQLTQELERGSRGEIVGQATPSLTIKQMWHAKHFKREDANNRHNHRKMVWRRLPKAPSLKRFAQMLLAEGNAVAKAWLDNKLGEHAQTRSDKNIARVSAERQASKSARKGSGK